MMTLRQNGRFILLLTPLLGLFLMPSTTIAQPQVQVSNQMISAVPQKTIEAKVAQLLQQSEVSYTKVSGTVWKIPYQGKSLANFDVIVATVPNSDLLLIFAKVAEKKQLRLSQDLLYKLLRFGDSADSVKVIIDDDGNLFIRLEPNVRTLDLEQFKADIEQVSATTDELHRQIKGSLSP